METNTWGLRGCVFGMLASLSNVSESVRFPIERNRQGCSCDVYVISCSLGTQDIRCNRADSMTEKILLRRKSRSLYEKKKTINSMNPTDDIKNRYTII